MLKYENGVAISTPLPFILPPVALGSVALEKQKTFLKCEGVSADFNLGMGNSTVFRGAATHIMTV
jgi:hypothetical protein